MFGMAKGPTVVRQTISRKIEDQNKDFILMAQPIPPGSTINQINLNFSLVAASKQDAVNWNKYTLHGCFVGFPDPNHGFGNSMTGYDTMWDNYVPKDVSATQSLDQASNDSVPEGNMMSFGDDDEAAVESGNVNGVTGGIGGNALITVDDAPELFFSREKRLDVLNGIVVDSDQNGKYLQVDKYQGAVNKNYFLSRDRYWYALMAIGTPHFDSTTAAFDFHPGDELDWFHLAYPEISVLEGTLYSGEDNSWLDNVRKHLESYYIDVDTVHDLDENDGAQDYICTLESTITYRRPQFEGIRMNSDNPGF